MSLTDTREYVTWIGIACGDLPTTDQYKKRSPLGWCGINSRIYLVWAAIGLYGVTVVGVVGPGVVDRFPLCSPT